jgi:hypothetical protein
VENNVSVGNGARGFSIGQALTAIAIANSAIANGDEGFFINGAVVLNDNNIYGNGIKGTTVNPNCGVVQIGAALADAQNNFWGDPAGPGIDPADNVCINTLYIDATFPAAQAFKVKTAKAAPY